MNGRASDESGRGATRAAGRVHMERREQGNSRLSVRGWSFWTDGLVLTDGGRVRTLLWRAVRAHTVTSLTSSQYPQVVSSAGYRSWVSKENSILDP